MIRACVSSASSSIVANQLRAGRACRLRVVDTSPRWMPIFKTIPKICRRCSKRLKMRTAFAGRALQREEKATSGFELPLRASPIGCATNSPAKKSAMPATYRVFKRDCIAHVKFFNGAHRFLPTLIKMEGFRVVEVPVSTNPRFSGNSHYGVWNRLFKSFRDLLAVRWMKSRQIRYEIAESND